MAKTRENRKFHPDKPYNGLPFLPPRARIETIQVLKMLTPAARALADLKRAGDLIPNQSVLLRSIFLQEAKYSSEIENIFTTNDRLYKQLSYDSDLFDPPTKEVMRYLEAALTGIESLKRRGAITPSLCVEIVREIKQFDLDVRTLPGTKIVGSQNNRSIYCPPEGEVLIRELLDDLCNYLNEDDAVDPLIKMAVAHYQFEAIHPFMDGNGRTGRILNILYLVYAGILDLPVLYLSRYIIEHKADYYQKLLAVTAQNAWEDWILFILDGLEKTAIETRDMILEIHQALKEATETAKNQMKTGYSKELIELIFERPYTRLSFLEERQIAKRQSGSAYLQSLESIGLLKKERMGRDVLYINERLLGILSGHSS